MIKVNHFLVVLWNPEPVLNFLLVWSGGSLLGFAVAVGILSLSAG